MSTPSTNNLAAAIGLMVKAITTLRQECRDEAACLRRDLDSHLAGADAHPDVFNALHQRTASVEARFTGFDDAVAALEALELPEAADPAPQTEQSTPADQNLPPDHPETPAGVLLPN